MSLGTGIIARNALAPPGLGHPAPAALRPARDRAIVDHGLSGRARRRTTTAGAGMSWLFPDERAFFEHFSSIAASLTTMAELLVQAFDQPARLGEVVEGLGQGQRATDESARDLDVNMDKLFIPPMDREDIHLLSSRLSRVGEYIGGTARRGVSLHAGERREAAVALARIILRAAGEIEAAVRGIRQGDAVLAHCLAVKEAEEEGDEVWEAAMTALFAGTPDPVDVIRWNALYGQLEDTLDACDDVANELETITVKHT
jgi:uncharacterized protein Yka (UPF0111/DUF47 family)